MTRRLLVLGGTRSGKSRSALARARELGGDDVTFVATARAGDPELDARIAAHRAQRPPRWTTREVESDLAGAIVAADPAHVLLVDSLTLWASTVVEAEGSLRRRWAEAADALERRSPPVVLVSDEVGMGIVPMGELARRFLDELGWLQQQAAASADEVWLMVAGIPLPIKGTA